MYLFESRFDLSLLAILLKDVLMRSTLGWNIRMVVPTQDVGRSVQGMMANPPTPLSVAVDLTNTGVHADSDRTYECRLAEIGAEA